MTDFDRVSTARATEERCTDLPRVVRNTKAPAAGFPRRRPSRQGVKDRQPASNRASWVWPMVTVAVLLVGAVALCIVGLSAAIADYDGITSWMNVVTLGSCCGAAMLVVLALPVATFVHEAFRDR